MTPLHLNKFFLFLLSFCFPLFSEESVLFPLFSPPKNWEVAKPDSLAPKVKIGFFGKAKTSLPPSINLAVEPTTVDLPTYLKAVKKLYESDKDKRWRNLGSFSTKSGPAVLTSIDFKVDEDEIRVLQLILLKQNKAYLLTAASLKADYPKFQSSFLSSFASLELLNNLSDKIEDPKKRILLEEHIKTLFSSFEKKSWATFQKFFLKEFKSEGTCWQLLFLDFLKGKNSKNPS